MVKGGGGGGGGDLLLLLFRLLFQLFPPTLSLQHKRAFFRTRAPPAAERLSHALVGTCTAL